MDINCSAVVYLLLKNKDNNHKRKIWSQLWFIERHKFGHNHLIDEYRHCPRTFREYMKMSEESYLLLLDLVGNSISKQDTVMRLSISAHDRLAATIRFLATGESLSDLQARCNISRAALSSILPATCQAKIVALKNYLRLPLSQSEWKQVASKFHEEVI